MTDIGSPIFQWLNLHPHLAGIATFIISTAESVAIIGTIIPGSVMMTAIGALAGAGVIPLWSTLIWAILGAIAGDGISYWAGRYFNNRLPLCWPFRSYPTLLENGERFFHRYGSMSVFIGRFVGPVRALVPLVAGMLGMSPLRFTIANVLSAIGWAPIYMLPGILLGAASLELPPDVAVHALLVLLLTCLFIVFCFWLLFSVLHLINRQIDFGLTRIWNKLRASRRLHSITTVLQHHDNHKTHGQLVLAFYVLCAISALAWLMHIIMATGAIHIFANHVTFFFCRSLRAPDWDRWMLALTFLGDKMVLLPLSVTLAAWLFCTKRIHTAIHVLLLGLLTAGSVVVLKHIAHSPRPWGVLHNPEDFSFPSGHVTCATVFWFAIALLVIRSLNLRYGRRLFYWFAGLLVLAISFSRLYLGAHWLTDVSGSWLTGAIILMIVLLSWNRRKETRPLRPTGIITVIILTLLCTYSFALYRHFAKQLQDAQPVAWSKHITTEAAWWNQQSAHLPFYRINRFGLPQQIFNLQWQGNLTNIQHTLLAQGWQLPPANTWIDALHRITDIESNEHLPMVAPLYRDEKPVLVLIKQNKTSNQPLVVLRLWAAGMHFSDTTQPLWTGTVEVIPRTYSWLFGDTPHTVVLSRDYLFSSPTPDWQVQTRIARSEHDHHRHIQPMLLIRSIHY